MPAIEGSDTQSESQAAPVVAASAADTPASTSTAPDDALIQADLDGTSTNTAAEKQTAEQTAESKPEEKAEEPAKEESKESKAEDDPKKAERDQYLRAADKLAKERQAFEAEREAFEKQKAELTAAKEQKTDGHPAQGADTPDAVFTKLDEADFIDDNNEYAAGEMLLVRKYNELTDKANEIIKSQNERLAKVEAIATQFEETQTRELVQRIGTASKDAAGLAKAQFGVEVDPRDMIATLQKNLQPYLTMHDLTLDQFVLTPDNVLAVWEMANYKSIKPTGGKPDSNPQGKALPPAPVAGQGKGVPKLTDDQLIARDLDKK